MIGESLPEATVLAFIESSSSYPVDRVADSKVVRHGSARQAAVGFERAGDSDGRRSVV